MSYPDQEKRLEKDSKQLDISQNPKRFPDEVKKPEPDAGLPVGKLKWSKEQEENADGPDESPKKIPSGTRKDSKSPREDLREVAAGAEVPKPAPNAVKFPGPKDSGKSSVGEPREPEPVRSESQSKPSGQEPASPFPKRQESPDPFQAGKESREQASDSESFSSLPPKRPLSLEDTLTPIHFKEYSLDPLPDEKNQEETDLRTGLTRPLKIVPESATDQRTFPDAEDDESPENDTARRVLRMAVKILWLPALLLTSLVVGLMIGHSAIGNEPASDVFDLDMWEHVYRLIYG
ncbi:DNA-directed RNA polymerase subunit beta [Staphylospora marina]|uniref:DNA-directed RNA polymerase subunit beta n=1 Tax=Staphylospora marina TaxID=2490858 RepID=UPI000F5BE753|nr:DNA-directed RNA polymerase subunit beta [Staphylospora marina]